MKTTNKTALPRFSGTAFVWALGLLLLPLPGTLPAEEGEPGPGTIEYRHRAELFLGVAHENEQSRDEFAAGLAYEYRVGSLLGVGGFVEHAGQQEDTWTFGVPLFVHPYKGLRFLLAPGWECKEVKAEGDGGAGSAERENEQSFLVRVGVAYEFEVGRWSLTPEFNADFIEGGHQVLVYGVSLGCGF